MHNRTFLLTPYESSPITQRHSKRVNELDIETDFIIHCHASPTSDQARAQTIPLKTSSAYTTRGEYPRSLRRVEKEVSHKHLHRSSHGYRRLPRRQPSTQHVLLFCSTAVPLTASQTCIWRWVSVHRRKVGSEAEGGLEKEIGNAELRKTEGRRTNPIQFCLPQRTGDCGYACNRIPFATQEWLMQLLPCRVRSNLKSTTSSIHRIPPKKLLPGGKCGVTQLVHLCGVESVEREIHICCTVS